MNTAPNYCGRVRMHRACKHKIVAASFLAIVTVTVDLLVVLVIFARNTRRNSDFIVEEQLVVQERVSKWKAIYSFDDKKKLLVHEIVSYSSWSVNSNQSTS